MGSITHSVRLEEDKCMGCINCIQKCPTEAIRVRNGKAQINSDRCIDCGECIRVCPHHAKKAIYDPLSMLDEFKYKVALPAPTLYGQFKKVNNVDAILAGLLEIGFDHVYEVALAAQSVADRTKRDLSAVKKKLRDPVISSACPAIVKLISIRFPELVDNVEKVIAPVELAALAARREAAARTGLPPEEIGIFFISPCPAKVTASKNPLTLNKPLVDGVLSMNEVYGKLVSVVDKITDPPKLAQAGFRGRGWAFSGGEGKATGEELFIYVDGIQNVLKVLEEVETAKLKHVVFVELNACPGGCVGGCLTVENPFVARTRIAQLSAGNNESRDFNGVDPNTVNPSELDWQKPLKYEPILRLDENRSKALEKMAAIHRIAANLPGLDCGSCGSPSCRALAEDIVMGEASEGDCVFVLRKRMQMLLEEMGKLQQYVLPTFQSAGGEKVRGGQTGENGLKQQTYRQEEIER